jgi:hypothetical protein
VQQQRLSIHNGDGIKTENMEMFAMWMLETTLCGSQLGLLFLTKNSFVMKNSERIIIAIYTEF